MKYLASVLLIISFIGIATFGPSLSMASMNNQGGCIASSIDGTTCPASIVGFSLHHLSALQTIGRAIVAPISDTLLLLASLLFAAISFVVLYRHRQDTEPKLLPRRKQDMDLNYSYSKGTIFSWLSLFELSPAS